MFSPQYWFEVGESLIDSDPINAIASFKHAGKYILDQAHSNYLSQADKIASNGCDQKVLSHLTKTLDLIEKAQDDLFIDDLVAEAS